MELWVMIKLVDNVGCILRNLLLVELLWEPINLECLHNQ